VLVNITGGRDLTLHEVNEASGVVVAAAGEDAHLIFGAVIDPNMDGEVMITVIATGFGQVPSLKLVDPRAAARPDIEPAQRPQPWRETGRWTRTARAESLEVPTFLRNQPAALRNQMD
jgi:cell division protein FtsZ